MHEPPQSKPVMDVTAPRAVPQANPRPAQPAVPIHEPPQPAAQEPASAPPTQPEHQESATQNPEPAEAVKSTSQPASNLKPHESTTPVGAITIAVFAMLTLSTLAVMIYLQTN